MARLQERRASPTARNGQRPPYLFLEKTTALDRVNPPLQRFSARAPHMATSKLFYSTVLYYSFSKNLQITYH